MSDRHSADASDHDCAGVGGEGSVEVICCSSAGIGRFGASDVKGKPLCDQSAAHPFDSAQGRLFAKSREVWGTHSAEVSTEG